MQTNDAVDFRDRAEFDNTIEFFEDDYTENGETRIRHRVDLRRRGTNKQVTCYWVDELEKSRPWIWRHVRQPYQNWLKGVSGDVDGTPLHMIPGVDREMIQRLSLNQVVTVEDLAALSDGSCQQIGMGALTARNNARKFIEVQADPAKHTRQINEMQEELRKRDQSVEMLMQQMEEMQKAIAQQAAEKGAEKGETPKPKAK